MVKKRGDGKVSSQRKIIGCNFNVGVLNTVVIEGTCHCGRYYYYIQSVSPFAAGCLCLTEESGLHIQRKRRRRR